ncbi:Ca2+-binding protein, RTX toxin-related [Nitrosomonas sp. Nm51]|uniref:calcium-binding protein n=1 Tax=Nitrosomonas sp. Nm51 TaxID=133720 RepID=UPI0008B8EA9E|nr:calcium-binding protein [Nitrosomonas sp. Nm51]SER31878.1 Ca2+-binding protein, RTX toxin-related [Nitrosomonas sp. Nm51]
MSAGPELRSYSSNLTQANSNVRDIRGLIEDVDEKIDRVEMAIDAVDAVENKADEFSDTIAKLKLNLKLMDKAGPLKFLAKVAGKVLDSVQNVTNKVRDKAKQLAKKIDDSKLEEKLDAAQEKLDSYDLKLAGTQNLLIKNITAVDQLITALDKADEFDPDGDPAAPAAAGADALVAPPNDAITAINTLFAEVKEKTQILDNAVPSATFLPVLSVRIAFDGISSSLSFLRGPLNAVSKVLKPIEGILDAVGFIFKITVEPIIDYILDTLGINRIINSVSDKINKLLPNPGIFDNILEDFDTAFLEIDPLGQLEDYLGVSSWLDELNQKVVDPVGDTQTGPIGIGTPLNDPLTGTGSHNLLYGGDGDDTLTGEAGTDIMVGAAGNDFLDGGSGTDIAVFSGSFLEYNYSQSEDGESITFNHLYPTNPNRIDGTDETQNIELYVFADIALTPDVLLNSVFRAVTGQNVLDGTENRDILFGRSTAITINAFGGNDMLAGSPASGDFLNGGSGDDLLVFTGGEDTFSGGSGSDTWRFPINNESGNPTIDADIERGTIFAGSDNTSTLSSIENIVVEDHRQSFQFGDATDNRLVAAADRDVLDGRAGNDFLDGGGGQDILIGGPGSDALFGAEGNDTLVAGDVATPGSVNFYDGGEGDFDALTYASDIRDVLQREYINDGIRLKARSQEASGPVRIFAETGQIERLSTDGNTVIVTDTAVNIEQFAGSDFDDTLYGGSGNHTEIDGGLGNDTLYGERAGRYVGGGAGDDTIYAGTGGARYDGGGGFDTLYLTEVPDVRWLVRIDGSIGSSLRVFNALEGSELATPDGSLQNESGPSVIASGNVENFDVYHGGGLDDYFDIRERGLITVYAGDGNDFVLGNNGGDNNPSFELHGESGDDEIVIKEAGLASGGEGDDTIEIDAGLSQTVQAMGDNGDDIFILRSGDVNIDGGEGRDTLSANQRSIFAGLEVDLLAGTIGTFDDREWFTGNVRNVEELIGANDYPDLLQGSNTGERFIGGGGNDTIHGRGGQDALYGGPGNDNLFGNDDDDLLHGGAGNDLLDGGSGIDTASWAFAAPGAQQGEVESSSFGHLDADLDSGSAIFRLFSGGQENNTLAAIENIIGGDGNDTLRGDSFDNMLAGGSGDDLLEGRGGNDVLVLDGDDTANGGTGDDRFVIGLGDMSIDGGDGNDTLDFGTLKGTIHIDTSAGTYEAELEFDKPVWKDGSGTAPRNANGIAFTPQDVLEADATFSNSTDDLALNAALNASETDTDTETETDADLAIDFVTETQTVSGTFSNIEQFIAGAATLVGSAGDDRFDGDDGVNVFEGKQGNDIIDGQGGSDTTIFSYPIANYTISRNAQGIEIVDTVNDDGRDTLTSIERLLFSDIGIAYDLDSGAGQVAKLIGAVLGAGHVNNSRIVGIGLDLLDDGMSSEELAELAIQAAGLETPQEIVTQLWTNVVGSPPTTQQAQPYIDALNNDMTTGELGVLAAETDLNAVNIGLVGLSNTGIEYTI